MLSPTDSKGEKDAAEEGRHDHHFLIDNVSLICDDDPSESIQIAKPPNSHDPNDPTVVFGQ
jgi:hypothetical protein